MRAERVVIIGAGIGGLAAAILLASKGLDVTVVEKAAAPGGKIRQLSPGSRPIDAGPTVFTLRWVFDELFAAAGADFGSEVALRPLAILARHAWDDGSRLDLHAERGASADAIARFASPEEGRRFEEFCRQAARTYRTLEGPFLRGTRTNPIALSARIGLSRLPDMASIRPFSSLWRTLGRYFHDPRLQQLFGRYATYSGASPFSAPATLMLIADVEQQGVWSIAGGMQSLASAMAALAERCGAKFSFGSGCNSITTDHGRISGVCLDNGQTLPADRVVANCDPSAIGLGLLGHGVARAVRPVGPRDRSLSALVWVADGPTSGFPLSRHNVFFSADYRGEFDDLRAGRLPAGPTAYVCAQDRETGVEPEQGAPERLQIIVNAPALGDLCAHSSEEIDSCQARMFERLARCGLAIDPRAAIALTTPTEFERLFPGTGGALYGRATHGWASTFRRPGSRTTIPGLYLAGGATHPGAGVPMAALSGSRAAESVLEDSISMRSFHPAAIAGGISTRSARTGVSA